MKSVEYRWEHPLLKRFQKNYGVGEILFRQGDPGNSLFIVIRGIIMLTAIRDGQELSLSALEAGHVLGEKALLNTRPYKRFFGARAVTEVTVAELTRENLEELESSSPALVVDIYKSICRIAVDRLDRLDHLIKVLRPADNVERLAYLVIHLAHFEGRETPEGTELLLPVDTVRYYLAMSEFEIEECLRETHRIGVLIREGKDTYRLSSPTALLQSIANVRDALPSIPTI